MSLDHTHQVKTKRLFAAPGAHGDVRPTGRRLAEPVVTAKR